MLDFGHAFDYCSSQEVMSLSRIFRGLLAVAIRILEVVNCDSLSFGFVAETTNC